jgi:hypothetical protein
LQLLGASLYGFAFGLQGAERVDVQKGLWIFARLQPSDDGVKVLAEEGDV